MPRLSVAWVMLQRVPPDMRILTPALRFFSRAARAAALRGAGRHQARGAGADDDHVPYIAHSARFYNIADLKRPADADRRRCCEVSGTSFRSPWRRSGTTSAFSSAIHPGKLTAS